jgi:deoxycytidine triphosphate deaminase
MSRREEEKRRLESYPICNQDVLGSSGVLLSDEIHYYAIRYRMIEPFNKENLKAASYYLTIGNEYCIEGESHTLEDATGKNEIRIDPFQVAIIQTRETINLPRFIIARWNIRVTQAYEGLLWVGGPQVDPGWVGYLRCPVYNLSDKRVVLRKDDPIATIDFSKTTPFVRNDRERLTLPEPKEYDRPPKKVLLSDYDPEKLKSVLYSTMAVELKEVKAQTDRTTRTLYTSITIFLTLIAVIITSFIGFVAKGNTSSVGSNYNWWVYFIVGFASALAFGCIVMLIIMMCKLHKRK